MDPAIARVAAAKGDQQLWKVLRIEGTDGDRKAHLALIDAAEAENLKVAVGADLVVVAEFGVTPYPGLISTGKVQRGRDKPFHTVINGENYPRRSEALTYTHRGKVNAII